ncbi:MAG: hypothetical protein FWC93_03190 [Defluviitaleaceae bacterium]|nr:hypothetical protein [Defluviitaleaceae bacterium]
MNRKIGIYSSIINVCAVAGFAVCLLFGFTFGSYLASMFIAYSFVPMVCAFAAKGKPETKTAGNVSMMFAGMYAVFILLVYFTQITTLRNENLTEQAAALLDYSAFGWFFNLNLLGYGLMSLSTFFAGMTIDVKSKADKALKYLLMIHGVFAVTCFVMPILGVFADMQGADLVGTAILAFWCIYFIPVGALSFKYFREGECPCQNK